MSLKYLAEEAAVRLGLKNPIAIGSQIKTSVVLRWKNEAGKYEQVEIVPETLPMTEDMTVETIQEEISRLIQVGETTVLDGDS